MKLPHTVALVGPAGIGRIHAREFFRAEMPVSSVMASTPESSGNAARDLTELYGNSVTAYSDLGKLAAADIDAAVICSPPSKHLEAINAFLDAGKYVLCEKPLFWRENLSIGEVGQICDELETRAAGRLLVNTNNTWFPEIWFQRYRRPDNPREFGFRFYTNGPYQGDEIGVDLLPHALSVLFKAVPSICGHDILSRIEKTVAKDRFECRFELGDVACHVDLRENPDGEREFGFRLNDTAVERIQRVDDGEYRVYLAPAGRPEEAIAVTDPFEISIRRFIDGVHSRASFDTQMATASKVMKTMTQIIRAL